MSRHLDYWETQHGQSIEDIKECALKGQFSCQFQPLLDIKLENVVIDELHLMLRITGTEKSMQLNNKKRCLVKFITVVILQLICN
jgi:hypothetical protein